MVKSLLKAALVAGLVVSTLTACEETAETPSTGTGTSFTYANLAKTWTSGCITATDSIYSSANRTKISVTLNSNGSYNSAQYWYTGGSCVSYAIAYFTSGTYSIGTVASGLYPLNYTITSSTLMTWNVGVQTAVNSACGGTSPWNGGTNASDAGVPKSTYMMLCSGTTLPSSSNKFVDNVGSLSGGVLSLGANQNGVPGGFQGGGQVPTSTSVDFY